MAKTIRIKAARVPKSKKKLHFKMEIKGDLKLKDSTPIQELQANAKRLYQQATSSAAA